MENYLEIDQRVTKMSNHDLALEILENLSNNLGVDFFKAIKDPKNDNHHSFFKETLVRSVVENHKKNIHLVPEDEREKDIDHEALISQLLSDDMEFEPNWQMIPSDIAIIKNYRGDEINNYFKTVSKRFESITNSTSSSGVGAFLMKSGISAILTEAGFKVAQAWFVYGARRAVAIGINAVSLVKVKACVAIILVGFILWLLDGNPKEVFGMIINQSPHDLFSKPGGKAKDGIYMDSGNMKNFMQDSDTLSSPKYQIAGSINVDYEDETEEFYYSGVYFAQKKFGFYGSEGVFSLGTKRNETKIGIMFACPYFSDNGINLQFIDNDTNLETLFTTLSKTRKVSQSIKKGRQIVSSNISSSKGRTPGNIVTIQLPESIS